jgi:hypothetical protein
MADVLTDFIIKPSAPFAAGVILFGVVWGFFKGVESVLTDDTKLEIAIWLVGVKPLGPLVQPWPETFAKLFDRVFGKRHLTWRCFWRSSIASLLSYIGCSFLLTSSTLFDMLGQLPVVLFVAVVPDYVSLLKTRRFIGSLERHRSVAIQSIVLFLDFLTGLILAAILPVLLTLVFYVIFGGLRLPSGEGLPKGSFVGIMADYPVEPNMVASFFSSIWLWLYAGSGFLLKLARRFDIGFDWFNRKFDIEKKPLSAIGLVAGAIVAVLWWTVVAVRLIV